MGRVIDKIVSPLPPAGCRLVVLTTTTTNGEWAVDYSAEGFQEVWGAFPTAARTEASTYDRAWASLKALPTLTGATGYAIRGSNMSLLGIGPTVRNAPDGTVIQVLVVGK